MVTKTKMKIAVEYMHNLAGMKKGWYVTINDRNFIIPGLAKYLKMEDADCEAMLINNGGIKNEKTNSVYFKNKKDAQEIVEALKLSITLHSPHIEITG